MGSSTMLQHNSLFFIVKTPIAHELIDSIIFTHLVGENLFILHTLSEKNYETLCFYKVTGLSCIYEGIKLITTK